MTNDARYEADFGAPAAPRSAAEWLIALDAEPRESEGATAAQRDTRFAEWLAADARREAELARCESALALTRELVDDPDLEWAFAEAAALARGRTAPGGRAPARRGASALRHGLGFAAWVCAALVAAAVVLVALLDTPPSGPLASNTADRTAAAVDAAAIARAATLVASAPLTNPVVVLSPSRAVVDARSIAVLPFAAAADDASDSALAATLAAALHREARAALAAVPGLYVIDERSVLPYALTDLSASEVGAQLGARAILRAIVATADGRMHVAARLLDAAGGATLWQAQYDRSIDELPALGGELVESVVGALVAAPSRSDAAVAAVRPVSNVLTE